MNNGHQGQGFWYAIKQVYWELSHPNQRFLYLEALLSWVPGYLGLLWRKKFYARYFERCGSNLTVYQGVKIRNVHHMSVGDDVYLGIDNTFQAGGGLIIKDRTAFGPGCKVWTLNHRFDELDKPIMEQGYEYRPVVIGPDVWLAANVFVMPGVELPEGCVVSAGSVVGAKKYPPYSIIAGNPARVIGNRKKQADVPGETVLPELADVKQQ
ncbi:MAG TPA: acyltransferase [Dongiaceae bacterium]|nr:acyltransferase [Dongiaceae bacterium]